MVFDIKWVQEAEGHFINGENFVNEFGQVTEKLTHLSTALKCYTNLTETMSEYEQNYKLTFDKSEEEVSRNVFVWHFSKKLFSSIKLSSSSFSW